MVYVKSIVNFVVLERDGKVARRSAFLKSRNRSLCRDSKKRGAHEFFRGKMSTRPRSKSLGETPLGDFWTPELDTMRPESDSESDLPTASCDVTSGRYSDSSGSSSSSSDKVSESSSNDQTISDFNALFQLQKTYTFISVLSSFAGNVFRVTPCERQSLIPSPCGRGRHLVLKLSHPHPHDSDPPREVRTWLRCQEVPGVARLLAWHRLSGRRYAVLSPLYRDDSLRTVFCSPRLIQSYMRQFLTVVQRCLERGVFHRDLKPSNLFWDAETEQLVLSDFDHAAFYPHRRRTDTHVSTRGFRAPEVDRGNYDCRADVYSAGVIFAMLLHHEPHEGDVEDDRTERWKKGRHRNFHGDSVARDLMVKMLEKHAARRPSWEDCLNHPYFMTVYD